MTLIKREISDYLEKEYKDYAMYVIENRAVPSVIDGFKPVQRKVIQVARKAWRGVEGEKEMKVFQLTGKVANECFYHHGDSSLNGAIISMAQRFKNNLPLLEDKGQYGSLRAPEAAAPRYIGTRLTKNFNLVYKDFELLTSRYEEGYEIEPQFFLPIIPTVLINGGSGIAVGYSSNILNRNPKEVVTACLNYLYGKKITKLKPFHNEFKGSYTADKETENRWIVRGVYEIVNTTTIRITELPPSMTYEKWDNHLDKLIEDRKIRSYESNGKENIDYTIKMSREDLDKLQKDAHGVNNLFKLYEASTEYFTTLDEKGKLKLFSSAEEIIEYFVDFRLSYYDKRKEFQIERLSEIIRIINNRALFIQCILDGSIVINKKSKDDITKQIIKVGLETKDDSYDYLLSMPIHSLSKEKYESLKNDLKERKDELKVIKSSKPVDIYVEELEELKKKL